jgi:hypothetical protein
MAILGATALFSLMFLQGVAWFLPAGLLLLMGMAAVVYRPRYGLYLILFFALSGDAALWPWYPFVKNLSSPESLLYLNSAVIFSPLEFYVALIILVWLGKGAMQRKLEFFRGDLFWPAIAFGCFVVFGLLYGLGTGGNLNIALWEARPIFLLPIMLVLASNLLEKPEHIVQLMWFVMAGIFVEGLAGTYHYLVVLGGDLSTVEAITEHAAAVHMNTLFIFVIAVYFFRTSLAHRIVLPLLAPAVMLTYLATQRRAAYLSLGVAILFIFALLYQRRRKLFWLIVPVSLVLAIGYLGVFWNASGPLAMPASAVKSVVAPDMTGKDYSSNVYRILENINLIYTIHAEPLTGVGFGQKFHIVVPMPDISFFIWWEYIVHNSILWFWIQTGVFGFISMLFLVSLSILTGVRAVWRLPDSPLRAVTLVATLYIVMHFMYAYVDMSWDVQSMLYVGTMMGVLNCVEHVAGKPKALPAKRWPWQANPAPAAALLPLSSESVGK